MWIPFRKKRKKVVEVKKPAPVESDMIIPEEAMKHARNMTNAERGREVYRSICDGCD